MSKENFKFKSSDATFKKYTRASHRSGVKTWQKSSEYEFELHTGHATGSPVYVRPDGNTDTSNLPKFDTKSKSASDYASITDFANKGKLQKELSKSAQEDLLAVIKANWDVLAFIGGVYAGAIEYEEEESKEELIQCAKCNQMTTEAKVKSASYKCPNCNQYWKEKK